LNKNNACPVARFFEEHLRLYGWSFAKLLKIYKLKIITKQHGFGVQLAKKSEEGSASV